MSGNYRDNSMEALDLYSRRLQHGGAVSTANLMKKIARSSLGDPGLADLLQLAASREQKSLARLQRQQRRAQGAPRRVPGAPRRPPSEASKARARARARARAEEKRAMRDDLRVAYNTDLLSTINGARDRCNAEVDPRFRQVVCAPLVRNASKYASRSLFRRIPRAMGAPRRTRKSIPLLTYDPTLTYVPPYVPQGAGLDYVDDRGMYASGLQPVRHRGGAMKSHRMRAYHDEINALRQAGHTYAQARRMASHVLRT